MSTDSVISGTRQAMDKAVEFFAGELRGIRTGRASTGLVENMKVEYYGNPTPLKQMATLAAPQADQIVIKPFDPASIKDIEKAIRSSDLSMAPQSDGKMIRLTVPALSGERRNQLVGQVKHLAEQARVSVRNIRRDAIKELEELEDAKLLTEDELEKGRKDMDNITKDYTGRIDSMLKAKSDEIMKD
ncbi:MAG TPA: ribosome recycling factor [Sedimentisphaerales bacterium]|nr:ribosome recycling factor [Sedimentisphaerales bacterium]